MPAAVLVVNSQYASENTVVVPLKLNLWRGYGISVLNAEDDTMLLSHSLHPEALKGLAYLGSIYTDEASWKLEVRHSKTIKKEN